MPKPHGTQEKGIKRNLLVMISAGPYRSTEKGYE